MAKQIKFNEFVDAQSVEAGLNTILASLNKVEESLKSISKASKNALNLNEGKSFNDVKKLNDEIQKSNKVYDQKAKIAKERIEIEKKLKVARSNAIQQNVEIKLQLQEQNKINKQLAREKLNLVGAYEKESKRLIALRKQYKDLALSEGEGSAKAKALLKDITALDNKLKSVDKSVGQSQRNVGNYGSALQRLKGSFTSLAGAAGLTVGVMGAFRVLKDSIGLVRKFESANAQLAGVLGTTQEGVKVLTEDALRLGAATSFSANEVAQLQTEFAKLGFNESEILNATEATLDLAAAVGADLGEAAAIAGATLGGFGLGAEETQRVVDVMAKSFSTSALDLEKFKESMKTAAPAAKAVGINVEETTALLGTLANAGISGSMAGNNLKSSFINLNKAGLTLEQGLEKVANSENKLGTAAQLVGKNAAASFLILAEGTKTTEELTLGLEKAGGAAKVMAEERLNTLDGALALLNSAWEGFILNLNSGTGAAKGMANVVRFLADNLVGIITTIGALTAAFLTYKLTVTATNVITKAYTITTNALKVAQAALTGGVQGATVAMRAFNAVTKANPVGILVTVLAAAVTAFIAFRDSATDAMKAQEAFNAEAERARKQSQENVKLIKEETNEKIIALQNDIRIRRAAGEDSKKLDEEFAERRKQLLIEEREDNKLRIKAGLEAAEIEKQNLLLKIKSVEDQIAAQEKLSIQTGRDQGLLNKLKDERSKLVIEAGETAGRFKGVLSSLKDANINLNKEIAQSDNDLAEVIAGNTDKTSKEYQNRLKELELLRQKLEDIENGFISDDFERQRKVIKTKFEREIKSIKGNSQVEKDLRVALKRQEEQELQKLAEEFFKANGEFQEEKVKELAGKKSNVFQEYLEKRKTELENELKLEEYYSNLRVEIQKSILSKLEQISTKRSEQEIEAIDKEIAANEKRQDQLRELAQRDVLGADQSIAAEKKRAAELEKERQQEVRKQELKTAGFKILSALLEQGKSPQEAIPEVGLLLGALPAVIDAIPTFYTGTNTTVADALGSPHLNTQRDGYIIRADGSEKILNPSQSKRTGGRTTDEITSIVEKYDNGLLTGLNDYNQPKVLNTNWQTNDQILSKFNSLEKSIINTNRRIEEAINKQPVLDEVKFNKITKEMMVVMKSNNKTTNTRSSIKKSIF